MKSNFPVNLQDILLAKDEMSFLDDFMNFVDNIYYEKPFSVDYPWMNFLVALKAEIIQGQVGYSSFSEFIDYADIDSQIDFFEVTDKSSFEKKSKHDGFENEEIDKLEEEFEKKTKTIFTSLSPNDLKKHEDSIKILENLSLPYTLLSGEKMFSLLIRYENFWKKIYPK